MYLEILQMYLEIQNVSRDNNLDLRISTSPTSNSARETLLLIIGRNSPKLDEYSMFQRFSLTKFCAGTKLCGRAHIVAFRCYSGENEGIAQQRNLS